MGGAGSGMIRRLAFAGLALFAATQVSGEDMIPPDLAAEVNPFIGTTNGGNVYPGATMPFGLVAFSPEAPPLPGRSFPIPAPGGYAWRANAVRGFAPPHLSGPRCHGPTGAGPPLPLT